jgi:hypothetical protein
LPCCQLLFVDSRPGGPTLDLVTLEFGELGSRAVPRGTPFEVSFDSPTLIDPGLVAESVVDMFATWAAAGAVIGVTGRRGPAGRGLHFSLGAQRVALVSGAGALAPGLVTLFRSGVVWGQTNDCATFEGDLVW